MIIYKATNKINGKSYCGQTTDTLKGRISDHKSKAKYNTMLISQAIREFGIDNFIFETLCECASKNELNKTEEEMIILHHTHYTEGGYNKQKRSCCNQGWSHSKETKKKMSEYHKNKILSEEHKRKIGESVSGNKNPMYNVHRKHTEEEKKNISFKLKGRSTGPKTEEHKIKLSITNTGKHLSEETKRKISESSKNYWEKKKHEKNKKH